MKIKKQKKIKDTTDKIIKAFKGKNDPFGSYTGNPVDKKEPVQDADDI